MEDGPVSLRKIGGKEWQNRAGQTNPFFASCTIVFVEDEWQQEGTRSCITREVSNFLRPNIKASWRLDLDVCESKSANSTWETLEIFRVKNLLYNKEKKVEKNNTSRRNVFTYFTK